jgi:hypothetical protein
MVSQSPYASTRLLLLLVLLLLLLLAVINASSAKPMCQHQLWCTRLLQQWRLHMHRWLQWCAVRGGA